MQANDSSWDNTGEASHGWGPDQAADSHKHEGSDAEGAHKLSYKDALARNIVQRIEVPPPYGHAVTYHLYPPVLLHIASVACNC